jgi:hypothetical protein
LWNKYITNAKFANRMTGTRFFDLPIEIRLQIYSELLVQSDVILVPWSPGGRLVRSEICLYPEILRVCRRIHRETSPLLYSANRFQFHWIRVAWCQDNIAKFLGQIGAHQWNFIGQVCITFPRFHYTDSMATVCDDDLQDLKRIQSAFSGVTTIELHNKGFPPKAETRYCGPLDTFISVEAIDLLDQRLRAIPSLNKIVVKIDRSTLDSKDALSNDLMNRMRDYGWIVEITELKDVEWWAFAEKPVDSTTWVFRVSTKVWTGGGTGIT